MKEEILRRKYRNLLNNLLYIRSKLKNLEEESNDLYTFTGSNINVDEKIIADENFTAIKNNFKDTKSELREKLIFSVSKKI